MRTAHAPQSGDWSVIVPFFNEEGFTAATIASLARQALAPSQIILVDNGSTDGSRAIIEAAARRYPEARIRVIEELTPGKGSALKTGLAAVATEFVATCDADTVYPPSYIETADRLFAQGGQGTVAVLAFGVARADSIGGRLARLEGIAAASLMPGQTHSGGYGQSFRTNVLKNADGFGPEIWPFCLMDHEVMHRVGKIGRLRYDYRHWCAPAPRRASRIKVRWTIAERLLYHVSPCESREWLFYKLLRARFGARRVFELNLRVKPWLADQAARRSPLSSTSDA